MTYTDQEIYRRRSAETLDTHDTLDTLDTLDPLNTGVRVANVANGRER